SAAFVSAGPLVTNALAPISVAMTCARVVFPRPGGPWRSTCSIGSPRWRAAATAMRIRSTRSRCPMYSSRRVGRSDQLACSSSGESAAAAMMRSVAIAGSVAEPLLAPDRGHHAVGEFDPHARRHPLRADAVAVLVDVHDGVGVPGRGRAAVGPHLFPVDERA